MKWSLEQQRTDWLCVHSMLPDTSSPLSFSRVVESSFHIQPKEETMKG